MLRAGGHVLGESGWELADQPHPDVPVTAEPTVAPGSSAAPVPSSPAGAGAEHPEPDTVAGQDDDGGGQRVRDECPDCGKTVPVNKDGGLRKHTCQIEARPPQVTFDEGADR